VGEFATTFFGALMGIIGSSKLLQALARDDIIPGLGIFGKGSGSNDEPRYAVLITYTIAQFTMLFDLNQIASLVTMAYLLTFLVTNLACFTLKIGGAPNFRPAFRFFSWQSAALGTIISCAIMIYVDSVSALGCVAILISIFLIIHFTSPPKTWGDVSQSLIFHQVRKYLLRLKQEHVKFWRPSFLLFVNDARKHYKLIQFCNSLKKGGLFILGHVIVTDDFKGATAEIKRQQKSWTKYIDTSKIKAFTNLTVSDKIEWGARNLVLTSGMGGMRPNIVMLGFFNLREFQKNKPLVDVPAPQQHRFLPSRPDPRKGESSRTITRSKPHGTLPTDLNRAESAVGPTSYVTVLEDLIRALKCNVAIATSFEHFKPPGPPQGLRDKIMSMFHLRKGKSFSKETRYIDLWPVQMSAFALIDTENHEQKRILTTNFDTYTMILQLGAILTTVDNYEATMKLRVSAFVEYENEVEQERERVQSLLSNIRINAEVRVFWLASGDLKTYEVIVNGVKGDEFDIAHRDTNEALRDESWWQDVSAFRNEQLSALQELADLVEDEETHGNLPSKPRQPNEAVVRRLQRLLKKAKRRISKGNMDDLQAQMRVQLSHLDPDLIAAYDNPSDSDDDASEIESTPGSVTPSAAASPIGSILSSGRGRGQSPNRTADLMTPPRPGPHERSGSINSLSAPIAIHPKGVLSDTAMLSSSSPRVRSGVYTPRSGSGSPRRPPPMRHQSLPKFTSSPVPQTKIFHEEGSGRSIMFVDPTASENDDVAAHDEHRTTSSATGSSTPPPPHDDPDGPLPPASGFPAPGLSRINSSTSMAAHSTTATAPPPAPVPSAAQRAMPLSFNDLPSRAQHLILNELILSHAAGTAVVFTTLPAPAEGTGESEVESVRYLSDLEVLTQGLPPTVLVHSNAVSVTVSL
jgi:solute carrier family 12 (potassium/chloride transporters), member 9